MQQHITAQAAGTVGISYVDIWRNQLIITEKCVKLGDYDCWMTVCLWFSEKKIEEAAIFFPLCFSSNSSSSSFSSAEDGAKEERERTRKRRWCCKCWIPLWTASFLAECFQWATARSWNLANETHTPPPPPPTHPPRGLNVTLLAENLSGGKWLADQVLREQLSERVTSQTHSIHIQCGTR